MARLPAEEKEFYEPGYAGRHFTAVINVVDPDPAGSGIFCRIRSQIRNKSFRIRIRPIRIRNEFDT
jgi:hypothetical protein